MRTLFAMTFKPMHTMMGGLIIRFHILICILYVMRDIYIGCPLISELLQNYQNYLYFWLISLLNITMPDTGEFLVDTQSQFLKSILCFKTFCQ